MGVCQIKTNYENCLRSKNDVKEISYQEFQEQYDLKNMLPAGSSYSGIIAELFIEYNIRTNKFKVLCIVKSNKSEYTNHFSTSV